MGNTPWNCNKCNYKNECEHVYGEICRINRVNEIVTRKGSVTPTNLKNTLIVEKSALVKMQINQKARRNAPSYNEETVYETFIDPEFPPNKMSLFINGSRIKNKNLLHSSGFRQVRKWLRPHEITFSKDDQHLPISLFCDPSPKDVIQGELGSCWFLSALSLLAEKPFLLLNCMISQKLETSGLHQVRLCRRGEWVVVNIDDFLPCNRKGQLIFSLGRKKQLWVPFLEKALAKLYGSYEAIAKGACADGLQSLTGEPCDVLYLQLDSQNQSNLFRSQFNYDQNPSEAFWRKIIYSKQLGYLMTTLCYNDSLKYSVFDRVGLLHTHIYSILDVKEFWDENGSPVRLVRLRNPWGHKEWRGKWSNNWPDWPEHIKAQVSVYANNDGCFWISFQDVLKYFYDITICKVRANWTESRQSSYFYDYSYQAEVFMISITEPGVHEFEIELFANGRKSRLFDRNADPDIDLCLVICRVNDPVKLTELTCLEFEHSVEYYINLQTSLTPGYYIVFATSIKAISSLYETSKESDFYEHDYYSYNIVFHCQSTFSLNRTLLPANIVSDIFYSVALKSNKVKYDLNGNVRTIIISGSCTHAIFVENLSNQYSIKVVMNLTKSKNLESTRYGFLTEDYIAPGTRQLVVFLTPANYRKGYVIGYKLDTILYPHVESLNSPQITEPFAGLHIARKNYQY